MHTVTKVLVVFAALLCVLLAALTMAYSVNADRIVADHMAQVDQRIATETASKDAQSTWRIEQASLNQQLEALSTALAARDGVIRKLEGERAELVRSVRAAEAARDAVVQKIDQLAATTDTQAKLIENLSTEVTTLRNNELTYRREAIQYTDRINDLESQGEVLAQNVRALTEQLEEARLALEKAATGIAAGGDTTPRPPTVPVRGRVLKTSPDPTGGVLAQIDLGSNDQIKKNMKLLVIRGEQFIGNLVILETDLKVSVGRVDTLGRNVEVRADDEVLSSFR